MSRQQHQQTSPQWVTQSPRQDDVSTLHDPSIMEHSMQIKGNNTGNRFHAPSVMNKSIYSGGGLSEGKFIDHVGAYPMRSKISPTSDRSPPSRPIQARGQCRDPQPLSRPQGRAMPSSKPVHSNNEYPHSTHKLNDLKGKNAQIRDDIELMKSRMNSGGKSSGGPTNISPSNYFKGGVNVAAGIRVGSSSSKAFPRTSPTSSHNNKDSNQRYGIREDPIARAMQRSDDARSQRSGGASISSRSLASGSLRHGNHHGHSSQQSSGWRQGGYTQRQPPSPARANINQRAFE